jgi:N-carbamoyl-L-amino-acid hydrolase
VSSPFAVDREAFVALWESLLPIGRNPGSSGYRRYAWTPADLECRAWFREQAASRGLDVEQDRNGNLWAWFGDPAGAGAVVTGSHLDSVPDGGAYDGPLGVVTGFAALDLLRARGVAFTAPVAIVAFTDEEGARFGAPCVGSRLMTGHLSPDRARALTDADGQRLADAMRHAGAEPDGIGRDDERLRRIRYFIELHVEQGKGLGEIGAPVGVGTAIWPHGRWRFDFDGVADHAGTTRIEDRRDPMLTCASTVLSARKLARLAGALATVGKVRVQPNGTNTIPSHVQAWLDSRAPDEDVLLAAVADIEQAAREYAERDGVRIDVAAESYSPEVIFDSALRDHVAHTLGDAPQLATGAGHDAGVLAAEVPAAMLFVRNPSGVSHSPREYAEEADCLAGVEALGRVLQELACR